MRRKWWIEIRHVLWISHKSHGMLIKLKLLVDWLAWSLVDHGRLLLVRFKLSPVVVVNDLQWVSVRDLNVVVGGGEVHIAHIHALLVHVLYLGLGACCRDGGHSAILILIVHVHSVHILHVPWYQLNWLLAIIGMLLWCCHLLKVLSMSGRLAWVLWNMLLGT